MFTSLFLSSGVFPLSVLIASHYVFVASKGRFIITVRHMRQWILVLLFRELLHALIGTINVGFSWYDYLLIDFIKRLNLNNLWSSHRIYYSHFLVAIHLIHRKAFLQISEVVSSSLSSRAVVHLWTCHFTACSFLTFRLSLWHPFSTFGWVMVNEVSIPYVLHYVP